MATHTYTEGRSRAQRKRFASSRSAAQSLATLAGLIFVVGGVAGFIPSLTTHSADLAHSGPDSRTLLFGLYQVSVLQNILHVATGVVALMAANGPRLAKMFLVAGGLAYLGLTAWGFMIDLGSDENVLSLNTNANWLHLGLGASMVLLGVLTLGRRGRRTDDTKATHAVADEEPTTA